MSKRHYRGNKDSRKEKLLAEENISAEELAKSAEAAAEVFAEVKTESDAEGAKELGEGSAAGDISEIKEEALAKESDAKIKAETSEDEAESEIKAETSEDEAESEIKAETSEDEAESEIKAEASGDKMESKIKVESLEDEEEPEIKVETLEQMLAAAADDSRPVRKIQAVLEDPRAEDDAPLEDDESYQRNWQEEPEKGGGVRKTVLIVLILAAIIAIIAVAYKVVDTKKKQEAASSPEILIETASAEETMAAADTTAAPAESTKSAQGDESTQGAESAQITFEKDSNADITKLITDYYTALTAGDLQAVKALIDPSVTIDEDAVTSQKDVVEAYQNIASYAASGKADGEYVVYTTYDMKFKDVNTAAPGLVPFYVKTQEDGSLKLIPYSCFDDELKAYIADIAGQKQVEDLAAKVNDAFTAAVNGDEDLAKIVASMNASEETEAAGSSAEAAETTAAASLSEAAETSADNSGTEAIETTAADSKEAKETKAAKEKFKEVDDIQYTTTQVKLRKKAVLDNDSNDFLLIDGGVWVHVVGISDHWAKVITQSGNTGYIYRDYLSVDKPGEVE